MLRSKNIYGRQISFKPDDFQLGREGLDNAEVEGGKNNLNYLEAWWKCPYRSDLDKKLKEFQWTDLIMLYTPFQN